MGTEAHGRLHHTRKSRQQVSMLWFCSLSLRLRDLGSEMRQQGLWNLPSLQKKIQGNPQAGCQTEPSNSGWICQPWFTVRRGGWVSRAEWAGFWRWHLPGGAGNRPDLWHSAWDLAAELNHCGSPWWGSCAVTGLEIGEEFTSCCRTLHNNQGKQAEAGGGLLLSWHGQPGTAKGASLGAVCWVPEPSAALLQKWAPGWPSQSWHQSRPRYKHQPGDLWRRWVKR